MQCVGEIQIDNAVICGLYLPLNFKVLMLCAGLRNIKNSKHWSFTSCMSAYTSYVPETPHDVRKTSVKVMTPSTELTRSEE
jgi:hypothetical protein